MDARSLVSSTLVTSKILVTGGTLCRIIRSKSSCYHALRLD